MRYLCVYFAPAHPVDHLPTAISEEMAIRWLNALIHPASDETRLELVVLPDTQAGCFVSSVFGLEEVLDCTSYFEMFVQYVQL